MLQKADSVTFSKIDYEHATLTEQLDLGLLALEIDVYADTQGGKYAHPKGLDLAPGQPPYDAAGLMKAPGFKVFHIRGPDYRSNAPTFKLALQELKKWSLAHPNHNPVFITVNAKSEALPRPGLTVPEPFTPAVFEALDQENPRLPGGRPAHHSRPGARRLSYARKRRAAPQLAHAAGRGGQVRVRAR